MEKFNNSAPNYQANHSHDLEQNASRVEPTNADNNFNFTNNMPFEQQNGKLNMLTNESITAENIHLLANSAPSGVAPLSGQSTPPNRFTNRNSDYPNRRRLRILNEQGVEQSNMLVSIDRDSMERVNVEGTAITAEALNGMERDIRGATFNPNNLENKKTTLPSNQAMSIHIPLHGAVVHVHTNTLIGTNIQVRENEQSAWQLLATNIVAGTMTATRSTPNSVIRFFGVSSEVNPIAGQVVLTRRNDFEVRVGGVASYMVHER